MRRDFLAATALGSAAFVMVWSGHAVAQTGPYFDWAGPYAGISAGANSLSGQNSLVYPDGPENAHFRGNAPVFNTDTGTYSPWPTEFGLTSAFVGTATVGTNFQAGNTVYGFEGDASYSGLGQFDFDLSEPIFGRTSDLHVRGGLNSLFTLRPRVGIAVDRLLLFGTGGLALGQATFETNAHITDLGKGAADWAGKNSAWKLGYAVGGGAEYAVTDQIGVKFDALYYNLGKIDVIAPGSAPTNSPPTATPYNGTITLQGTIARVGVNFHM